LGRPRKRVRQAGADQEIDESGREGRCRMMEIERRYLYRIYPAWGAEAPYYVVAPNEEQAARAVRQMVADVANAQHDQHRAMHCHTTSPIEVPRWTAEQVDIIRVERIEGGGWKLIVLPPDAGG